MPTVQIRNPEQVALLSADLQLRYEPQFAWVNAISAGLMLPALRAAWTFASRDNAGASYDVSGQGRTLSRGGSTAYSWSGLAPRAAFVAGTNDYLYRADEAGLDILGTEAFEGYPGLTLGGWFYPSAGGTDEGLISKWVVAANQRAYLLRKTAANTLYFGVSVDGAAAAAVNTAAVAINAWQFLAGRFTPSAELATFINGTWATNAAGIPASIFNASSAFEVGRYDAANYYTGSAALVFLCAAALPASIVNQYYEQTRALFGV